MDAPAEKPKARGEAGRGAGRGRVEVPGVELGMHRQTAVGLGEVVRAKAMGAQLQAEEFLKTQPGTASGIAAGLGFLVGLITARR